MPTSPREGPLVRTADDAVNDQLVAVMDRYELSLYRYLYVLLGDAEGATDCAQDTFLRAHNNLRRGKPVNAGWLYTVARNRAMDEHRHRRRQLPVLLRLAQLQQESASPEQSVEMREAFNSLDPNDRSVLYLAAVEGLSGAEIAVALGIKPNAARMRICRARERFRLAYGGGT